MANSNSNLVADKLASPPVLSPAGKYGPPIATDNFELTAANIDAGNDTITLVHLPSNARIHDIVITNDDLDTASDLIVNVGIYPVNADGTLGTVDDVDAFATAVSLQAAANRTSIITEAATAAQRALMGDRLWEWAGDTADPGGEKAIVMTVSTASASAAAGTLGFEIHWSRGT